MQSTLMNAGKSTFSRRFLTFNNTPNEAQWSSLLPFGGDGWMLVCAARLAELMLPLRWHSHYFKKMSCHIYSVRSFCSHFGVLFSPNSQRDHKRVQMCVYWCTRTQVSYRMLLRAHTHTNALIYILYREFLSFYYWYLETLQIEHAKIANGHVGNNLVKWIFVFRWIQFLGLSEKGKNCTI